VLGGDGWQAAESADLLSIQEELLARGKAPAPLDLLAEIVDIMRGDRGVPVGPLPDANGQIYVTPGVRIVRLRRDLTTNVQAAARLLSQETGLERGEAATDINRQIMRRWRQRERMEEEELTEAIVWVREYYGVH
jgi:hypothetical protein